MAFLKLFFYGILVLLLNACSTIEHPNIEQKIHEHYIGQGALDTYSRVLNNNENKKLQNNLTSSKDIAFILKDNILYIKLFYFHKKSAKNLKKYILKYTQAKGIILDLRGNTGGIFEQAIETLNLFINKGLLLRTISRTTEELFYAKKRLAIKKPLVILVNNMSASASEITAGVLQEKHRALIVGQTTYGKGSIQEMNNYHGTYYKVTVEKYYLPSGKSIEGTGVVPDVVTTDKKTLLCHNKYNFICSQFQSVNKNLAGDKALLFANFYLKYEHR